jgi:hypothetical protein
MKYALTVFLILSYFLDAMPKENFVFIGLIFIALAILWRDK